MTNLNLLKKGVMWAVALAFLFVVTAEAADSKYYQKTLEEYEVPDVVLLNQDGKEVHLKTFFEADTTVVLDFIFGTCTTICPVLSVGFAYFQKKTIKKGERVRLVSISIDPDNDTPEIMKEYLQKYNGQPGWDVLTGKRADVISVLRSFDAYVSNKMDHFPLTILRAPGQKQWVRLYGMLSASDLMKEYELLKK